MEASEKQKCKVSRAFWENLALYLVFVCVYSLFLGTAPASLEGFESWVKGYLPLLDKPWPNLWSDMMRLDSNDSNCSVNSPPWFYTIRFCLNVFGDVPLAYRLPGVLVTAFVPVLTASIVRRFLNPKWALLCAILTGASHHTIWFARTGGYIGPTMTLFLLMVYLSYLIAFENRRWAWIPLSITFFLSIFFYSVIRYYFVIAVMVIAYKLITSREFRRTHILPISGAICFLAIATFPITQHGLLNAFLTFFSARGEQLLITERIIKEGPESENLKPEYRYSGLLRETIPTRFSDLVRVYHNGRRFFHPLHQEQHEVRTWWPIRWWVLGFFGLGFVSCLAQAVRSPRYIIPVLWSVWAWIPLLVTTGIYPGRLLLGLPADMLLITVGLCTVATLPARFISHKLQRASDVLVWLVVLLFSVQSVVTYFQIYL